MIDTDSFIKGMKVSWIHYLNIETTAPWVQLAKHIVGDIDKVLLFGSDWAFQRVKQINKLFWKDALSAWICLLLNIFQKCNIYGKIYVPRNNGSNSRYNWIISTGYLIPYRPHKNAKIMSRENIALFLIS